MTSRVSVGFTRPGGTKIATNEGGTWIWLSSDIAAIVARQWSDALEHAMIVERIWTGNAYRNFNYLIACPETGEALAIDPLDHEKTLNTARARGWRITQVLNTHEHRDHTGGNEAMVAATGAKVLAHANAKDKIPEMDRGLRAGDVVKVGRTVELESWTLRGTRCPTSV